MLYIYTGMHPLKNYPGRYLIEGKVKYRSHNYQCLPDVNKVYTYLYVVVAMAICCILKLNMISCILIEDTPKDNSI